MQGTLDLFDAGSEGEHPALESLFSTVEWGAPLYPFPLAEWKVSQLYAVRRDWYHKLVLLRCGSGSRHAPSASQIEAFASYLVAAQRLDPGLGGMRGSWLIPEDPGMPADARVDFAYFPTYIAVAWLILARQRHPDILQQERRLDRAIKRGLRFATGRRLMGHGYDASRELLAAVRVLALGQVFSFVREKPEFAPQFMALIEEVEDRLVNHLPTETGWSATPVSEQQQALALIRGGDREGNQVCTLAGQRWREHGADQF